MDHSVQLRFPVPSEETPRAFARGLLLKGVRATQLAEVARNAKALGAIAKLIQEHTGVSLRPNHIDIGVVTQSERVTVDPHKAECTPTVRIHGATRHGDKNFTDLEYKMVAPDARELLEHETVLGTDEATMFTVAFVPTLPFARECAFEKLMFHKNIRSVLKRWYPKFKEEDFDASLIVGLLRSKVGLKALALKHGFKWIVLLHKPVKDLCGVPRLLQISFGEAHGGIKVRTAPVSDETMWCGDGALAVLSR
jgi:hypothetical protein